MVAHLNGISAHASLTPAPPLLLVGTRRASVSAEQLRAADTALEAALKDACPAFKGLVRPSAAATGSADCLFAVENQEGFAKDATVRALAAAIHTAMHTLPALGRRVPLRWLGVYDELEKRKRAGQPTLSLKEVSAIGKACGRSVQRSQTAGHIGTTATRTLTPRARSFLARPSLVRGSASRVASAEL